MPFWVLSSSFTKDRIYIYITLMYDLSMTHDDSNWKIIYVILYMIYKGALATPSPELSNTSLPLGHSLYPRRGQTTSCLRLRWWDGFHISHWLDRFCWVSTSISTSVGARILACHLMFFESTHFWNVHQFERNKLCRPGDPHDKGLPLSTDLQGNR